LTQTIFHVDNNARVTADVFIFLYEPLKEAGAVVKSFSDPRVLIQAIEKDGMPDVVVTGDKMAGMTGCELAVRLRKRGFTGQIVMMPSTGGATDAAAAKSGINTLMPAPCKTFHLLPILKAALK
jgi:FixJ family two-component response regulator